MRILFLTNVFPNPAQPTLGTFNRELVRALAAENDVAVVAPLPWVVEWRAGGVLTDLRAAGRQDDLGGVSVYYPRYYYPPKLLRNHYGSFLWQSIQKTINQVVARHRPEVIVSYWAHPDGEVAVRAARRAGVPAAVMVGGSDVLLLTRDGGRRWRVLAVLHAADAVIAVGEDLRTKLVGFGVAPEKLHVVPRGVDGDRFSPGDQAEARCRLGLSVEGWRLLFVGRLVPVKGLDVLIEACRQLRDRGAAFELDIVGDGPERASLAAQAEASGLAGIVRFVGAVEHDELPDWYRAADLMVLPSRSEGIPNVLRESLACGTPFVATNVGGIPEIAEGAACHLVPPEDPAALAEAITRALGEAGYGRARADGPRPISWAESGQRLVRVLEGMVPSRGMAIR